MKTMEMIRHLLLTFLIPFLLTGCTHLVPLFTPEKERSDFTDTPDEQAAHRYFWNQLHQGNYDSLDLMIDRLQQQYAKDPRDFKLAAHLGFAYAWEVTERRRKDREMTPSIAHSADLAQRYFTEAVKLNPHDPRLLGFKSGFMLVNGDRHQDPRLQRQGYFLGQKSIRQWPTFNLFSIGYVMSGLDYTSDRYQEALGYQWELLEDCLCRDLDRGDPQLSDLDQIPERVKDDYKKHRACTNSWIAPHNVEGFMLNLGDMLVKNGDTAVARQVYASIPQVEEYAQWPYQEALASRMENLQENVQKFRRPSQAFYDNRQVFIRTTYGCMGCHQKSESEFQQQNGEIPLTKNTYFLK